MTTTLSAALHQAADTLRAVDADTLRAVHADTLRAVHADTLRTAGIATPRLDAEILLAHTLDISRADLLAQLTDPLPAGALPTFENLISRRAQHEPIAYLTHSKAFYGLDFYVDHRTLIPRPETELLVDRGIEIANSQTVPIQAQASTTRPAPRRRVHHSPFTIHSSQLTIADVGAGSGCIVVALAVNLPRAQVYATEASTDAMEVARANIERHGVGDRVRLIESDLLRDVAPDIRFDIIVANLPYVAEPELSELPRSVREYEPVAQALAAGPDGLDLYRRLLEQVPARLRPGSVILFEIGWRQGESAATLAREHFPGAAITVLPDLAGRDRVVEIR